MCPPDQCLDTVHFAGRQVELRLVVQHELVLFDRPFELTEHEETRIPRPRRFALLDRTPGELRFVHRLVGVLQQLLDVLSVVRVDREPATDPDLERDTGDRQRAVELALDLPQRRTRRGDVVDAAEQHRELVTAEPPATSTLRHDRRSRAATSSSTRSPTR